MPDMTGDERNMKEEKVIIIGGGPCGLSAAIHMQEIGIDALVIEKGNIVNSIYQYPTHQTFFSSSEKLEIGDVAFITENHKPSQKSGAFLLQGSRQTKKSTDQRV